MTIEFATTPVTTELFADPTQYYFYPKPGKQSSPAINIASLAKDAIRDIDSVTRISIPSMIWKQSKRGTEATLYGSRHPVLWELGGGQLRPEGRIKSGWHCQIVGSPTGGRVAARQVDRMHYDDHGVQYGGRHALCASEPGATFAVAYCQKSTSCYLVYQVVSVASLTGTALEAFQFKVTEDAEFAALNCELIGVEIQDHIDKNSWVSETAIEQGIDVQNLLRQLDVKMSGPQRRPINIEYFWRISARDLDRVKPHLIDDETATLVTVPTETFVSTIYDELQAYRDNLFAAGHPDKYKPFPASVSYNLVPIIPAADEDASDDSLQEYEVVASFSFPRSKGVGDDAVALEDLIIETTFTETTGLPKDLIEEPALVIDAKSYDELVQILLRNLSEKPHSDNTVTNYVFTTR